MKRMQREQRIHRSSSSVTRGPISTRFGFFDFFVKKTRPGGSKLDAVFLEMTFPRLVANRAIERMIDQKKLHHPIPAFLHHR